MNPMRIALAASGAFVAYFVAGGSHVCDDAVAEDGVHEVSGGVPSHEGMKLAMPVGMAAMEISCAAYGQRGCVIR